MKGGDIIIECLKAQGVRCIFGMPGTQNLHIYDSLLRCGEGLINHYLVRHEFAACLLYTSPSPRDRTRSRMPSSA